jgi:UDP-N-acetylmuramoylalanine--D-glutamate ligase
VVIKTPGVSFTDFIVPRNVMITCQTDLFMKYSDCLCVGVTGTKGKTTVAAMLYDMLRQGGLDARLIGHTGQPVLDMFEENDPQIAIVEMSSKQLEFTTASPHIAVLTNIYPEHIEHHNGFTGYVNSKLNIVRHQKKGDYFICNASQTVDGYCDFSKIPSTVIKVASDISGYESIYEAAEQNEYIIGNHNIQNVFLACTVARRLGVSDRDICAAVLGYK